MNEFDETLFGDDARRLAHQTIDRLFDHFAAVDDRPVVEWRSPADLQSMVGAEDDDDFLESVDRLLRHSIQIHSRRYMGHQVCPPFPEAVIADAVISALNQSTAVWEMSPMATVIEKSMVRWLCEQIPFPEEALGSFVSGGSAANLTALLAARARFRQRDEAKASNPPVIVCSVSAHYSVKRAASIIGISPSDVLTIANDDRQRMDVDELAAALQSFEESERPVMAIIATAGSTSAGAFDDLQAISDLRDRHRTWLHVDAAHGASTLLSPELRHLVSGLERADSLSWDPHKMLWMPLSTGVVLVRDGRWLRSAFEADAPYLFQRNAATENLGEITLQCSRRADAVKLWLTLRSGGRARIEKALSRVTETTRALYEAVVDSDDFQAMHEPQFNIFCFRWRGGDRSDEELDAINDETRQRLIESGRAWITATTVDGARTLRVTIINPRTSPEDVRQMLEEVRTIARAVASEGRGERPAR
jgi:L-2,4-diaminobutyrate decarboxylase